GLSFVFIAGLHRALRKKKWFDNKVEPDLRQYLDLVALATICDVMPLTGLNRAFVTQGLKVMRRRANLGLSALCDISTLTHAPTPYHLGFILGPRVNAGGRVGEASLGSRLLSTQNLWEAKDFAKKLDLHNKERQAIEAIVFEQAIESITKNNLEKDAVLLIGEKGWHPGVIGIVAGRLKEIYSRPVCMVSFDEKGVGKGSGRSIPSVHLGEAMHKACQKGLLKAGGGHAMAAGFTVLQDLFERFRGFLNESLGPQVNNLEQQIEIDGTLLLSGITLELAEKIATLEPYGIGNPTPRFIIPHVKIAYTETLMGEHIRLILESEDQTRLKAMAFRSQHTPLGQFLLSNKKKDYSFYITGTIKCDQWNGKKDVMFVIEDVWSSS
ncbi:MAG: single-stranded-DNA-specific exonuclease RecJ, partial [Proteobacteria bacterium]|nr:single-stranded-DNA-specific exonuclease RecJ [Pseudomonadota bacterium]